MKSLVMGWLIALRGLLVVVDASNSRVRDLWVHPAHTCRLVEATVGQRQPVWPHREVRELTERRRPHPLHLTGNPDRDET